MTQERNNQPQVSDSDVDVAYEIRKKVYYLLEKHRNASSGFFAIDEMIDLAIATILAKHRQSTAFTKEQMEEVCDNTHHAAVSADAVDGGWYRKKIQQQQHEATWAMAMEAAKNAEIPKDKEVSCYNLRQAISKLPCPPLQTTNEE